MSRTILAARLRSSADFLTALKMPHMHLGGRRLLVASDDFVLTSCLSLVARLGGAIVLVTVTVVHGELLFGSKASMACTDLGRYTLASLAVCGALLVHSVTMCTASGVGGVLQPSARSRVAHVLAVGVPLRVVELGCAIYGALQLRDVVRPTPLCASLCLSWAMRWYQTRTMETGVDRTQIVPLGAPPRERPLWLRPQRATKTRKRFYVV